MGEGTLQLVQISVNHPCGCLILLPEDLLALISNGKVLSATSFPFPYILLMSQDSVLLRMLDSRGFQT